MTELNWNGDRVSERVKNAFQDLALLYAAANTEIISEPGAFPDYNNPGADIVDTGRLRASQRFEYESDVKAKFSWNTAYAPYVHEGYVRGDGTVVRGRPWTEEAIDRLEPEETFRKLYEGGD